MDGMVHVKKGNTEEFVQSRNAVGDGARKAWIWIAMALVVVVMVAGCVGEKSDISVFKSERWQNAGTLPAMRPVIWNDIEISTSTEGKAIIVVGDKPSDEEMEAAQKVHLLLINQIRYDVIPIKKWSELTDDEKINFNLIVIGTPKTNPAIKKIFKRESIQDTLVTSQEFDNKKHLLIGGNTELLSLKAASNVSHIIINFNQAKNLAKKSNLIKKFENKFNISSEEISRIIDGDSPIIETRVQLSNINESIEGHIFLSATNGEIIEGEGYQKSWIRYLDWDKNPELVSIVEKARENVKEKIQQSFGNEKLYASLIEQSNSWTIEFYSSEGRNPISHLT